MWTRLFKRLRPTSGPTRPDQLRPEVFLHRRRPEDVVIDVRTPEEFAQGHLKGALNLDVSAPDFPEKIARLRPDRTYYLYCRSGNRSEYATRLLRERGLEAYNIGSLKALIQAGAEIER